MILARAAELGLRATVHADELEPMGGAALAATMAPNTSGLIVVAEDKVVEELTDELSDSGGQFVSVTMGSQLTGELASVGAVSIGDAGEADPADAQGDETAVNAESSDS